MKIKSIKLVDAYGRSVKALQKSEVTKTLGGSHIVLSFEVPIGYLTPKKIIHMEGIEPSYTSTFLMMNPSHPVVMAPAIVESYVRGIGDKFEWSGLENACRLNLRNAAHSVLLGGLQLSRWIEWEAPLEMRADRGWFKLKEEGALDAILRSGAMAEVSGALHKPHDKKFELVKSFKTIRRGPVLQVMIWRYRGEWVAEIDMDLKQGLGHWKEVVRNHLTSGKTHPYLVNQLLAWYWGVVSFKMEVSAAKPG